MRNQIVLSEPRFFIFTEASKNQMTLHFNIRSRFLLIIFVMATFGSVNAQSKADIDKVNQRDYQTIVSNVRGSIKLFESNVENARKINYKNGEAAAYGKLALAQYISGENNKSTRSYLKAIKLYEELGNLKEVSGLYSEFGYSLKRYNIGQSKFYMRKAIAMAEKHNFRTELPNHYNNFGVVHEIDGNTDSAIYYYRKALNLSRQLNDHIGIPYCYENISGAYAIRGDYGMAHRSLDSANVYREKEEGDFGRTENLSRRADLYFDENRLEEALETYRKVLSYSKNLNYSSMILHATDRLSQTFEKVNQIDSALFYARSFKAIGDSLNALEREKELLQLEVEYDAAQKDKEIAEKKVLLRNQQLQLLIISGIAVLLIVLTIFIWRWQKAKRQRQKLEAANKIKQEKIRISRELHDNIGSRLTFMISSIENSSYRMDLEKKKELDEVSGFGRNTLQDLRTTVWAMKNEAGTLEDLLIRIREMRNSIPNSIEFTVSQTPDIDYPLQAAELLNLYRITQEFVQNSMKYAEATEVSCSAEIQGDQLLFELKDNGKGFDISQKTFGSGLENMKQRAKEIYAEFELNTAPDQGVQVALRLLRHSSY